MSVTDDPPRGIPRWAWLAARELYARWDEIEAEAETRALGEQDPDAHEWEWVTAIAETVAAYAAGSLDDPPDLPELF